MTRANSLRRAFQFFSKNAGGIVGENAKGALALARAELAAKDAGLMFVWEWDSDADLSFYDIKDDRGRFYHSRTERERDHEVLWCRCVIPCAEHGANCRHATQLASLSNIVDPDQSYMRVVEAELALEAGALELVP